MRSTEPTTTGDMLCHLCGMYTSGPWYAVNGKFICKICYDEGKCNPVRGIDLSAISTRELVSELETRHAEVMSYHCNGKQCSINIDYNTVNYSKHGPDLVLWIDFLERLKND